MKPKTVTHEHCWHEICDEKYKKEAYEGPTHHWIEQCCDCFEFRREYRFL